MYVILVWFILNITVQVYVDSKLSYDLVFTHVFSQIVAAIFMQFTFLGPSLLYWMNVQVQCQLMWKVKYIKQLKMLEFLSWQLLIVHLYGNIKFDFKAFLYKKMYFKNKKWCKTEIGLILILDKKVLINFKLNKRENLFFI